ncbi:MAG: protease inhibitor I42 family protein [Candidatus Brocadiaceae bacterium]|nr:protease inhibitor I42 family protein [Candidatus Brocadiaceae bacterium]
MVNNKINLNQVDSGKTISVNTGDMIVINLPENPTTGFQWKMGEIDNNVVVLEKEIFSELGDGGIGSGGTKSFVLKVLTSGNQYIQLKHWRAWEGGNSVDKCFDITLSIAD